MIYAFNTIPEESRVSILDSLKNEAVARFGWSYKETQNLEKYPESGREFGTAFLLEIKEGDYIVHINLPEYGKCVCAKVAGLYKWRNPMDRDFNHCIPIDPNSIIEFDRNDNTVSPQLSSRLKLQGRYWRIYCEDDFNRFLASDRSAGKVAKRTIHDNIKYFWDYAEKDFKSIAGNLQKANPNFDLESLLFSIFEKTRKYESVIPKRGISDHGADIILTSVPFEGTSFASYCLVQVKSYTDIMETEQAIDDIKRAFEYYDKHTDEGITPNCALIVTTAEVAQHIKLRIDELSEEIKIPIGLLSGVDLARFVLKYI